MNVTNEQIKLNRRHEIRTDGSEHFAVIGELGALHFHVHPSSSSIGGKFYGGVEVHSKKPMYGDKEPDNEHCWIINCPCWHDGSSLLAKEEYIPIWEWCKERNDYSDIWVRLERHYRERLMVEDEV